MWDTDRGKSIACGVTEPLLSLSEGCTNTRPLSGAGAGKMESRVVVITGASSGIGEALAKLLASRGHRVVLGARRGEELQRVAAACGPSALPVVSDVTRRGDVEALRDAAIQAFGHVDVWVNNVGRGITRNVLELSDEDVDQVIAVNIKSTLYGMQAIVPHFQSRGSGLLINISSFLGRVPFATQRSMYSAAKAALNSLTSTLRMDLRRTHPGIQVCLVMPGMVSTAFAANAIGGAPPWPATAAARPVIQTPEEVAEKVATLLDQPVPELYTQPGQRETAQRYIADVGAFEASMGRPS